MQPGATKRQKELGRQQYQQEKAARRAERKKQKELDRQNRPEGGEDPDIAGIIPGPQPPLEDL